MYHSLQQLDLVHDVARDRAQQARSARDAAPTRPWILRLIPTRPGPPTPHTRFPRSAPAHRRAALTTHTHPPRQT